MQKEQHLLLLGLRAVGWNYTNVPNIKKDFSTELRNQPGFISGVMDSLKEAEGGRGARFSKQTTTTCTISQQRRLDSNYRLRAALLGSLHNLHGSDPRQRYNPL